MELEDRFWTLDKMESAAVRDYYTKLQNVRDELNTIVCENWDRVKERSFLTSSILRRLHDFYKARYQLTTTLKAGTIGTSTGEYLEEVIHSSLSAFLTFRFKEKVSIQRDFNLKIWKLKQRADIAVVMNPRYDEKGKLKNGTLVFVVECKAYVDKPTFEKVNKQYHEFSTIGYACITGATTQRMGARKRDKELEMKVQNARKKWLYVMSGRWFGYNVQEYDIKVLTSIEKLYDEILEKCKRQMEV